MTNIELGFDLDRRWHWLRGEMDDSKQPDLAQLATILGQVGMPYAIIGGIALQIHQQEPRTTLDIDVAIHDRHDLPEVELRSHGFMETGRFRPSVNWKGPRGTPIQFTDDTALRPALKRAIEVRVGDVTLRVLAVVDLLHEKLRAGRDPARRRSKRLQDLADVQALIEQDPSLTNELSSEDRALLDSLPV